MVLTDKQRQFVDAKARGASNKEAAEAAGCKASTAAAAGSRWANDPKIAAAILAKRQELTVNPERKRKQRADPDEAVTEEEDQGGEYLDCLPDTDDPLVWLLALMNEPKAKVFDRRNAAQTAVPYVHGKKGEAGKKEQKAEASKEASKGKFSAGKPPLSVVKG
ncbi:terminase small subunit [Pseudomonas abietaniphila]|uniref:Phage terminase small subunit n=1 Tax=Pseudomonas abietaniphila TaxID=89065 RepID=A0A1G8K9W2_9PSED|nr:terminase small subunit [Pseudomonas abietaniphila]SDI40157.1 phage terminase small subunit [Pseudomonas abietaniphila]